MRLTRIFSVRTKVPTPPDQPQRWTERPLTNGDDVADMIIELLPPQMVEHIADRLSRHLDLDDPNDPAH